MILNTPINYQQVDNTLQKTESVQLLKGEIAGANTYYHTVLSGETLNLCKDPLKYHVLFMTDGEAALSREMSCGESDKAVILTNRSLYAAGLGDGVSIHASKTAHFLEIEMVMSEEDLKKAAEYKTQFPVVQEYDKCEQYWDTSKTQKTINRIILEQENIPRLAMGSVESMDEDHVTPNNHPTVDQLFFTFAENETELIINDEKMDLGGNILLHIPLGADHGSDVWDGKRMHYIWCDFLLEEECVEYLREEHIKTGEQRSF